MPDINSASHQLTTDVCVCKKEQNRRNSFMTIFCYNKEAGMLDIKVSATLVVNV